MTCMLIEFRTGDAGLKLSQVYPLKYGQVLAQKHAAFRADVLALIQYFSKILPEQTPDRSRPHAQLNQADTAVDALHDSVHGNVLIKKGKAHEAGVFQGSLRV